MALGERSPDFAILTVLFKHSFLMQLELTREAMFPLSLSPQGGVWTSSQLFSAWHVAGMRVLGPCGESGRAECCHGLPVSHLLQVRLPGCLPDVFDTTRVPAPTSFSLSFQASGLQRAAGSELESNLPNGSDTRRQIKVTLPLLLFL